MPKANVYNMAGQQVGEVELSEGVFGVEPNEPAVHAVVVNHLANCRQGTQSALTRAKAASGDLLVVDDLALDAIKTKNIQAFLDAVSAGKTIFVTPEVNENVYKSARNIPGVSTTTAKILSVYDIVNAEKLVIDQKALAIIEEVFA